MALRVRIVTADLGNHRDHASFIIMLSPADILAGLLMHFRVILVVRSGEGLAKRFDHNRAQFEHFKFAVF